MIESRIIRGVVVRNDKTKQFVRIDLDVSYDINAIAGELAQKAYDAKTRRSYLLGGLLEVKRRGTRADPVPNPVMVEA